MWRALDFSVSDALFTFLIPYAVLSLPPPLRSLLVAFADWINQQQREVIEYLQEENRVLREQLGPQRLRFTDDQRVRLAAKAKVLGRRALKECGSLVLPDTLRAWHRRLIIHQDDGHQRRGPGRPRVRAEIRELILRMARENRQWGYTRIQGALANLVHEVGRGTIANILKQHGIEPAPERQKRTTWQEFLKIHWDVHAAMDFSTVDLWTATTVTRSAILFVIDLAACRLEMIGIESGLDSPWVMLCGRYLSEAVDGLLTERLLLRDRDPLRTDAACETPAAVGVRTVRAPPLADVNVHAKQSVRPNQGVVCESDDRAHAHYDRDHLLQGTNSSSSPVRRANRVSQRLGSLLRFHINQRRRSDYRTLRDANQQPSD